MKKIIKGEAPANLKDFVSKENPLHWDDIHTTKAYSGLYAECVRLLRAEQDNLCGYTERPLPSTGIHVDHFRKRALFPAQNYVFGWNNLIVDEHNKSFGADYKDNAIQKAEDYEILIDPVAHDPHWFFTYIESGRIKPKESLNEEERKMAEFTIRIFNLQHPLLCDDRREIIELVRDYKRGGLTADEIKEAIRGLGYPSAVEFALTLIS